MERLIVNLSKVFIMEKISKIIQEIQPDIDLTNNPKLIEDGYFDSLDIIRLVSMLEEEFKISINGNDISPENFNTVDAIKKLVLKYQSIS